MSWSGCIGKNTVGCNLNRFIISPMGNALLSEVSTSVLSDSWGQQEEADSSHVFITDYMQGLTFLWKLALSASEVGGCYTSKNDTGFFRLSICGTTWRKEGFTCKYEYQRIKHR